MESSKGEQSHISVLKESALRYSRIVMVFLPGFALIMVGITVALYPLATRAVLSIFLISAGMGLVRLTSFVFHLFRQGRNFVKANEGKFTIQGLIVRGHQGNEEHQPHPTEIDGKKDWLH